ncbi:MAG: 16S rRNA (cytosine(1402)-N(4))-methyltransferase RsmH [Anaerolineales bacterium]
MGDRSMGGLLPHHPVLYKEVLHALQPRRGVCYVDGTIGAGGHAWGILQASAPDGLLLGLDLDPKALQLAGERLSEFGARAILVQASYATLLQQIQVLGWKGVGGILLDLGVSSMQLDTPERGFSFQSDAPLDMRFDPGNSETAADLVNTLSEQEIADLIFRYGEERQARKIARAIVSSRPIFTTGHLSQVVSKACGPARQKRIHPATLTFQALRIAVNRELQALERFLPQAIVALSPGGRLVVIAYHSLEDRIVKQFLRQESRDCICPPKQPVCTCGHRASITVITRRPLAPQEDEIIRNPRARSARLRAAMKMSEPDQAG